MIASIDLARLCMVGMLDALSLKDSKLGLETLELMGHDLEQVRFVLNRSTAKVGDHQKERRRSSAAGRTCSSPRAGRSPAGLPRAGRS